MALITFTAFFFVIFAWLCTAVFMVGQKHEGLIIAFGKYTGRKAQAGLNLKWPWPFNAVAMRVPRYLQQVSDTLETKTKDNLFVGLPIAIQYEITDTAKYYFDTHDPVHQMSKIVSASVRKYTSGNDFQDLYNERDEISDAVIDDVRIQIQDYGIDIKRIVIDEPQAPKDIQNAYNRVRASEREKDAAMNEAEAAYIKTVKAAEADKQRNMLIGAGVAGFRKHIAEGYAVIRNELIGEGVNPDIADKFMEEAMRLDTIRDVGDKGNMVIVVPAGDSSDMTRTLAHMTTLQGVMDKVGKAANK